MEATKEKKDSFKEIIEAQTSTEFDSAIDKVDFEAKVSEVVGEKTGEGAKSVQSTKDEGATSPFTFSGISERISGLLGSKKTQKIVLPDRKVQQKEVVKALSVEVKNLVSETRKMQNSRRYSPEKLEKLLKKIRHLQKMIADVMSLATKTLNQWYKRYVLNEG